MHFCSVIAVLLVAFAIDAIHSSNLKRLFDLNPDIFRTTPELITSRGFVPEQHLITTDDGYVLVVFRIINPYVKQVKRPIILWHGLGVSSDSWLFSTEGRINASGIYVENSRLINDCNESVTNSLGFTLASCGWDVWLPNSRSGHYSVGHVKLDPNRDPLYWKFNLNELALYDIPAVVEFVLHTTGHKTVGYVAHSLGTDQMFALQSLIPESGKLFEPFIALAPVAYLGGIWSVARFGVPLEPLLRAFPGPLGVPAPIMQLIAVVICGNEYLNDICLDTLNLIDGADNPNFNRSTVTVEVAHSAVTSSTWLLAHLAQMVTSNRYQMMNHGRVENILRYGQSEPPAYPLGDITSPNIALFRGQNDALADVYDVQHLIDSLKVKLLDNYIVPYEKWEHHDFQVAITQGFYVNRRVLQLLAKFDHAS
ncbi:abc transporter sub-family a-like protein [Dermatophagoides farinae]|uniref:Lipase n=2 Tax=Dermatophagoides farinae TaxID=6954 RepID=A0A9D4NXZ7_DERFA|nr:lysosomal acid lipase/cholesteryl ester hydrolase-like [Dermatophagoides farinae]KAH7639485.1 abc transporter sub-family a-like protein [Dermatophagoides farinae]